MTWGGGEREQWSATMLGVRSMISKTRHSRWHRARLKNTTINPMMATLGRTQRAIGGANEVKEELGRLRKGPREWTVMKQENIIALAPPVPQNKNYPATNGGI
jgi:hypothetical protein